MLQRLSGISKIKTFRSDANFVFVEAGANYGIVSEELSAAGIVVKLIGNISGHRGCMRVTIGTPEINDKFLQTVEGALR